MRIFRIGRKSAIIVLLSCLFLVVSGCGIASIDADTLVLDKDMGITEYVFEDFDTTEYNYDDWIQFTKNSIEEYNSANSKAVTLKKSGVRDDILSCVIEYPSDNAFFELNRVPVFYGTIAQAVKAGYNFGKGLIDVNDESVASMDRLLASEEMKILIINMETDVVTTGDIAYIGGNVTLNDNKKSAHVKEGETSYIVFN